MQSGSYWHYVGAASNPTDSIRFIFARSERGSFLSIPLESILEAADLFEELKSRNARLINYLTSIDVLHQLIHLAISVPPASASQARVHKYPFLATEILICDNPRISGALASEWSLFDHLFSFITEGGPGNLEDWRDCVSLGGGRFGGPSDEETTVTDQRVPESDADESDEDAESGASENPGPFPNRDLATCGPLESNSVGPFHFGICHSALSAAPSRSAADTDNPYEDGCGVADSALREQLLSVGDGSDKSRGRQDGCDTPWYAGTVDAPRRIPCEGAGAVASETMSSGISASSNDDNPACANPVLSGYFCRIVSSLFAQAGEPLAQYLRQRPRFLLCLFDCLESRSIAELISSFLLVKSTDLAIFSPVYCMYALLAAMAIGCQNRSGSYLANQSNQPAPAAQSPVDPDGVAASHHDSSEFCRRGCATGERQENVAMIFRDILGSRWCLFHDVYIAVLSSFPACEQLMIYLSSNNEYLVAAAVEILSSLCFYLGDGAAPSSPAKSQDTPFIPMDSVEVPAVSEFIIETGFEDEKIDEVKDVDKDGSVVEGSDPTSYAVEPEKHRGEGNEQIQVEFTLKSEAAENDEVADGDREESYVRQTKDGELPSTSGIEATASGGPADSSVMDASVISETDPAGSVSEFALDAAPLCHGNSPVFSQMPSAEHSILASTALLTGDSGNADAMRDDFVCSEAQGSQLDELSVDSCQEDVFPNLFVAERLAFSYHEYEAERLVVPTRPSSLFVEKSVSKFERLRRLIRAACLTMVCPADFQEHQPQSDIGALSNGKNQRRIDTPPAPSSPVDDAAGQHLSQENRIQTAIRSKHSNGMKTSRLAQAPATASRKGDAAEGCSAFVETDGALSEVITLTHPLPAVATEQSQNREGTASSVDLSVSEGFSVVVEVPLAAAGMPDERHSPEGTEESCASLGVDMTRAGRLLDDGVEQSGGLSDGLYSDGSESPRGNAGKGAVVTRRSSSDSTRGPDSAGDEMIEIHSKSAGPSKAFEEPLNVVGCVQVLTLLKVLVTTCFQAVTSLLNHEVLNLLVGAFFQIRWNTSMHLCLMDILQAIIQPKEGLAGDDNAPVLRDLLLQTGLLSRLVQFCRRIKRVRLEPNISVRRLKRQSLLGGQTAHVLHVAQLFFQHREAFPEDIQNILGSHDGWNLVEQEVKVYQEAVGGDPLGGVAPSSAPLQLPVRTSPVLPLGLGMIGLGQAGAGPQTLEPSPLLQLTSGHHPSGPLEDMDSFMKSIQDELVLSSDRSDTHPLEEFQFDFGSAHVTRVFASLNSSEARVGTWDDLFPNANVPSSDGFAVFAEGQPADTSQAKESHEPCGDHWADFGFCSEGRGAWEDESDSERDEDVGGCCDELMDDGKDNGHWGVQAEVLGVHGDDGVRPPKKSEGIDGDDTSPDQSGGCDKGTVSQTRSKSTSDEKDEAETDALQSTQSRTETLLVPDVSASISENKSRKATGSSVHVQGPENAFMSQVQGQPGSQQLSDARLESLLSATPNSKTQPPSVGPTDEVTVPPSSVAQNPNLKNSWPSRSHINALIINDTAGCCK